MAQLGWLEVSKLSGNGNDSVQVGAGSNRTGRTARSTVMTYKAANCPDVQCTVIQAGKPEFVQIQATASEGKNGGTLTLSGKTNSSKLTFSLGSGATLALTLPNTYIANSINVNNGAAITGDPGASTEFDFSIMFTNIPTNTSVSPKTAQVIVEDNAGNSAVCTVTQAAGDPYLNISPTTIELPWDSGSEGDTVTITVQSNTNWAIEQ